MSKLAKKKALETKDRKRGCFSQSRMKTDVSRFGHRLLLP